MVIPLFINLFRQLFSRLPLIYLNTIIQSYLFTYSYVHPIRPLGSILFCRSFNIPYVSIIQQYFLIIYLLIHSFHRTNSASPSPIQWVRYSLLIMCKLSVWYMLSFCRCWRTCIFSISESWGREASNIFSHLCPRTRNIKTLIHAKETKGRRYQGAGSRLATNKGTIQGG